MACGMAVSWLGEEKEAEYAHDACKREECFLRGAVVVMVRQHDHDGKEDDSGVGGGVPGERRRPFACPSPLELVPCKAKGAVNRRAVRRAADRMMGRA